MQKHAPTMNDITRGMFIRAIAASAPQLGVKRPAQVLEKLHRGECDQCNVLRIHLAHQVAEYLASVDSNLRAVYFYNPEYAAGDYDSPFAEPNRSSAVYLMAWTRDKESAPVAVRDNLTQAFDQARSKIVCPNATALCFSLDIQFVDDTQVSGRKGYAAMIDSFNARPTQVWSQEHGDAQAKTRARKAPLML